MVKKNEEELLDTLAVIDGYIRKQNIRKLTEEEGHIFQKIRISTQKLLPEGAIKSMEAPDEKPLRYTWAFSQVSKGRALERFKVEYNKLHPVQKRCFLSLLHLPESVIKKMNIILWWNGLGLVENTTEQTGEKNGEDVFEVLVDYGVIVRVNFNSYPEISKCKIHPRVRPVSVRSLYQNDEKLTKLEVLKGFALGSSSNTPCRISDLAANSERLKRLSIHIGSGAVI
ncbi:hypothetical protein JHK85_050563 [Glycine max]|nr:hypothetical protein JHK85_050563 [Glycine max]